MRKLDLHDLTLEEAYEEFRDFIYEAYTDNISKVEIITGKSGQIRKEFPYWSENSHQIRSSEISWHGGSFTVKIEKKY
jgi:DNA-nicking Smr family endonuclease